MEQEGRDQNARMKEDIAIVIAYAIVILIGILGVASVILLFLALLKYMFHG